MSRIKLKNGGKPRNKAMWGESVAIIAAAAMNAAASDRAAKEQARAMVENAKTQAQTIKDQTLNNTNLQKEQLAFTKQENRENRQVAQDIQTSLQIMAGQENMNDRMERNKMQVKYGGRTKRKSISKPFYGGGNFRVTDGGGVIPLSVTSDGYGLYEIVGNDHEHYHKTLGGKNKTGVGIKFKDGTVVEGEGNQNTSKGEYMYNTPNDALFISKHDINGFNPVDAVDKGMHPILAYAIQEQNKYEKGLNNDGTKTNHRSIKRFNKNIASTINKLQYDLNNITTSPVGRFQYVTPIAKCGGRVTLKNGGNIFTNSDYTGAFYNTLGNIAGAGITSIGNLLSSNKLGNAYTEAGNILADAYSQMRGIDMSELSREDYAAPHTLAVVRQANTNINPQLERIRRNANYEIREINRGTLSSAARQQRLAAANDRMFQRMGEQYAYENNANEQIKQGNAERITQTAQANADRDVQANRDYSTARLSLMQYNNDINNTKILGRGQALADAKMQSSAIRSQALQNSLATIGNAINASGTAFSTAYDTAVKNKKEDAYAFAGMSSTEQENFVLNGNAPEEAKIIYNRNQNILNSDDPRISEADKQHAREIIRRIISNSNYRNINFN